MGGIGNLQVRKGVGGEKSEEGRKRRKGERRRTSRDSGIIIKTNVKGEREQGKTGEQTWKRGKEGERKNGPGKERRERKGKKKGENGEEGAGTRERRVGKREKMEKCKNKGKARIKSRGKIIEKRE